MAMTWKPWAVAALAAMVGVSTASAQTAGLRADASVTFTKDVAPILQAKCQGCHRPGMMAPMSLLTYQDARPWARSIKTKVSNREMPPVKPQPSEDERAKIAAGIRRVLASVDAVRNPGAVTMPRLNRAEYDNTIRDLTGLDLRPAASS